MTCIDEASVSASGEMRCSRGRLERPQCRGADARVRCIRQYHHKTILEVEPCRALEVAGLPGVVQGRVAGLPGWCRGGAGVVPGWCRGAGCRVLPGLLG
jgi:hypothetical protein